MLKFEKGGLHIDRHWHLPRHEAKSGQEEHILCAILYGFRCQQIHCCPPNEEPGCLERLLQRNFQVRHACIMKFQRAPWSALLEDAMEFVFFFCMHYDVFGVLHGQLVETPWSSLFFTCTQMKHHRRVAPLLHCCNMCCFKVCLSR